MHTKAPITLRVNSMKASREEYLAKLKDAEISATTLAHTTHGINLSSATDIRRQVLAYAVCRSGPGRKHSPPGSAVNNGE